MRFRAYDYIFNLARLRAKATYDLIELMYTHDLCYVAESKKTLQDK